MMERKQGQGRDLNPIWHVVAEEAARDNCSPSYTLHAGKFHGKGDWFEAGKGEKGVRFSKYKKNDGGRWAFGVCFWDGV